MKASICLFLAVAVFSTLFLGSSAASTGDDTEKKSGGLGGLLEGVLGSVKNVTDGVLGGVGGIAGNLFDFLKKLLDTLFGNVTKVAGSATGILNGLITKLGQVVTTVTGPVKDVVTQVETGLVNLQDTVNQLGQAATNGTAEAFDSIASLLVKAVDLTTNLLSILEANPDVGDLVPDLESALDSLKEKFDDLTDQVSQIKNTNTTST